MNFVPENVGASEGANGAAHGDGPVGSCGNGNLKLKNQRTWNLSDRLVQYSDIDFFDANAAYQGIICTGGTGGGKTGFVLRAYLDSFAQAQWGMCFTTVKVSDCLDYRNILAAAGRPVRVISPENPWTINLLETLFQQNGARGAGDIQGVVNAIVELLEIKNRGAVSGGGEARFWTDAAAELCAHCITLLAASKQRIQFQGINRIIEDLPQTPEQVQDAKWQKGYLNGLVDLAISRKDLSTSQQHDLQMALLYFLGRVPKMGDRLVGGITATVSSMIFGFIRSDFARLFDGETNLNMDYCFDGGSIILDIPVHTFLSGQMAQSLFKYVLQKMVLKRDLRRHPTPVALIMDEAQHFVAKNDLLFTSTCRSARCCTFVLTQNLDVLQHQIGQTDMEGLVGNLCTKIATSNDHVKTNTWFSSMCGEEWSTTSSTNVSLGDQGQMSSGVQDQRRYNLEPHELVKLRKPSNEFNAAEAVVFRSGRPFLATGKNYIRVRFQRS